LSLHALFSSSVRTTPFLQYQLFAVHVLQEIVIIEIIDLHAVSIFATGTNESDITPTPTF
jgi:hypothetical protein